MTSFARSPRSTLGIEWELALTDQTTRELVPRAPAVLAALARHHPSDRFPHFTPELFTNTVELVTAPHAQVRGAIADLQTLGSAALRAANRQQATLIGSGSHPFAAWSQQHVTPSERYERFIDRTQWWGRNMLIWGVHVHVGVDRRDRVIPLLHALLTHLPHLLSYSASSPFWAGEATGYLSNRTLVFQQLPSAGLPPEVQSWEELDLAWQQLTTSGIIAEPTEARWDIRPAPQWGTLELRVCDGATSLRTVGAIAALAQCLVEYYQQCADRGEQLPRLPQWCVRENKWRAARFGFAADVIVTEQGEQQPLREHTSALLPRLEPVAAQLGCSEEFSVLHDILRDGNSAQRQLQFAPAGTRTSTSLSAHSGDTQHPLAPLVDHLAAEFARGL